MKLRALKYTLVYTLPAFLVVSLLSHGWLTFLPLVYSFGIIPVLEYFIGEDNSNLSKLEREIVSHDRLYDMLLYLTVPMQVGLLVWFIFEMRSGDNSTSDVVGKVTGMGMMCGVYGINVAHELGHRTKKGERFLSKIMLSTSLYLHFYIEHNRGHHRNVGTPEDSATARLNEPLYFFWVRTIFGSWISAFNIVKKERQRKKLRVFSLQNEWIMYMLIELTMCFVIYYFAGITVLFYFLMAAFIGIVLLETVNYVEHYGLFRKKVSEHRYEDVDARHSWNSDYIFGRLVLFELTRHSDHHKEPSTHYQYLDSLSGAGQLPAGYPAMMLLSLLPPLWFMVMNPRIPK